MPDIEDSLRRYADALERVATARVDAPPHPRRGVLIACAAAIAIVAIASTAIFVTRDDRRSRVSTVASSTPTMTFTNSIDPNVWVTATVELDKTTFVPGEDVTGEITFTNHLPTDALITDPNGCLGKWGVGIAPGHARVEVYQTQECGHGATLPEPAGSYLAFRPGITRVPLRVSGTFQGCTGSDVVTKETPRCLANYRPPNLPLGPARIQLVISDAGGHVRAPGPIPIRFVRRGERPRFCTAAQLAIRESGIGLAMGSGRATFTAANTSHRSCHLDGYPVVGIYSDLVVTAERYSAIKSDHGDSFLVPEVRSRAVALRPGDTASFSVGYSTRSAGDSSETCARKLTALAVTLPDQGGTVDVPTAMKPCPGTQVGANEGLVAVSVSPFVAGSGGVHR